MDIIKGWVNMEFNEKQWEIIKTDKPKVIVNSCPATGKTRTLVGRVQYLLSQGENSSDIVVITFTNAAAGEMRERLGKNTNVNISTIHAYANYLLLSSNIQTSSVIEVEDYEGLFALVKQNPNCIKPVKYLLLDEGQDSNNAQFEFIFDLIKPKNWMIFADHRQSIYRWNGANPDYLINLAKQEDVTLYYLNQNYRNGEEISDFAKSIIRLAGPDYSDYSIVMTKEKGEVQEIEYNPVSIAKGFLKHTDYKDWFVLTRSNEQLEQLARSFKIMNIPYVTFKRSELNNAELYQVLKEDKVKLLTIHSAKGLESKNVIVVGCKFYDLEEICISYVAATRAKEKLIWTKVPNKVKRQKMISNWEN